MFNKRQIAEAIERVLLTQQTTSHQLFLTEPKVDPVADRLAKIESLLRGQEEAKKPELDEFGNNLSEYAEWIGSHPVSTVPYPPDALKALNAIRALEGKPPHAR